MFLSVYTSSRWLRQEAGASSQPSGGLWPGVRTCRRPRYRTSYRPQQQVGFLLTRAFFSRLLFFHHRLFYSLLFLPFLAFHAFLSPFTNPLSFLYYIFLPSSLPFSPPPIFLLLYIYILSQNIGPKTGSSRLENDLHECSTGY